MTSVSCLDLPVAHRSQYRDLNSTSRSFHRVWLAFLHISTRISLNCWVINYLFLGSFCSLIDMLRHLCGGKKVCARTKNVNIEFLRAGVNKWINFTLSNWTNREFSSCHQNFFFSFTAHCECFNPLASHRHVTRLADELSDEQLDPNGDVLSCLKTGNSLLFLYFVFMHDLKNWKFAQVQGSSQVHFFF